MAPKSDYALANSIFSIYDAYLEVTGDYVPHYDTMSPKLRCPYTGLFHNNPRTLRIYPNTNSAFCFSCNEYMTPVKLICEFKELSVEDAVSWIKEHVGYMEPDPEERWDAMMSQGVEPIDTRALGEALKLSCARMVPDWNAQQFDPDVSHKLNQCLALLSRVRSEGDSNVWLVTSKKAMARALGVTA